MATSRIALILVAVLVRLCDENEVAPGQWYLEAGFGWIGGTNHPHFSNLDMAQDWISQRVASACRRSGRTSTGTW